MIFSLTISLYLICHFHFFQSRNFPLGYNHIKYANMYFQYQVPYLFYNYCVYQTLILICIYSGCLSLHIRHNALFVIFFVLRGNCLLLLFKIPFWYVSVFTTNQIFPNVKRCGELPSNYRFNVNPQKCKVCKKLMKVQFCYQFLFQRSSL